MELPSAIESPTRRNRRSEEEKEAEEEEEEEGVPHNLIMLADMASKVENMSSEEIEKELQARKEIRPQLNELLFDLVRSIGGSEPLFVLSKKLERCDVSPYQNRLLFTSSMEGGRLSKALTADEMEMVRGKGLMVSTLAADRRIYKLKLKFLTSNASFRLITPDWKRFVVDHKLEAESHTLCLWAFHAAQRPWLLIEKKDTAK